MHSAAPIRVVLRAACPILVAALLSASGTRTAQEEAKFVPLFDGRGLGGWTSVNCAPETWSVRDGMIHCTGKPICELRTTRMYENFILELEYKHLEPGGNAGVFIWGDALTARGQPFVRAIEVQVLDGRNTANYTSHGDVFAIHGATMTPDRPHPGGWARSLPSERRAKPAGEWNHYRITARDGTLKLAVNGKDVSGGYDVSPRKGYIHLESEGGVVEWRNLRIAELPPSGRLNPDQIAREDEGFVSLYTGTDFRGWRHDAGHQPHWAAKDWTIASDGKAPASAKSLATERSFGDASVIVDWRWPTDAKGDMLPVRLAEVEWTDEARAAVARRLAAKVERDGWRRALITRQGGRVSLSIDGDVVLDRLALPGAGSRGPLALQDDGRPLEFANVFVKEPPGVK